MFIKSITFPKWHPFYNNGESIVFWDSQKDLIDFYLRTTDKIKEWEKDISFGNNIQINCILGDNWAGKSRFIREIYDYFRWGDSEQIIWRLLSFSNSNWELMKVFNGIWDAQYWPSWHSNLQDYKAWNSSFSVILDDFFILSPNIQDSIHNDLLKSKWWNWFYCDVYNFLKKRIANADIFGKLLNVPINYRYKLILKFKKRIDFQEQWYDNTPDEFNHKIDNYSDLLDWIWVLVQEYWNKETDFFKKFPEDQLNVLMILLMDLIFLYIEQLKVDILDYEYLYQRHKTDELDYTWMKKFMNWLSIIKSILTIIQKDQKEIISNKTDKLDNDFTLFFGFIPTYISRLDLWFNCLNSFVKGNEVKANRILSKIIPLEFASHLDDPDQIKSRFVDFFKKRYDTFLKEFIFKDIDWDFNILSIFWRVNDYYLHKIEDLNNSQSWIFSYGWKEIDDALFPFFILLDEYLDLDLHFYNEDCLLLKTFNNLSWGEKSILSRFTNIYITIHNHKDTNKHFIILIDEPDLHLHLDWQRQYIQKLIDVFSTLPKNITLHFIIATHSPFIVSDLPGENIIRMRKDNNGVVTFQNYWEWEKDKKNSFWANYIDIIQEWFFDNRLLMWSFAEEVITNLAITEKIKLSKELLGDSYKSNESYKRIEEYMLEWVKSIKQAKNQIWDTFLKNYLLYFKTDENNTNS